MSTTTSGLDTLLDRYSGRQGQGARPRHDARQAVRRAARPLAAAPPLPRPRGLPRRSTAPTPATTAWSTACRRPSASSPTSSARAPSQVILGDNASLSLMYDVVSEAFHRGVPGGARPWSREPAVKILCPSPGYDRHFGAVRAPRRRHRRGRRSATRARTSRRCRGSPPTIRRSRRSSACRATATRPGSPTAPTPCARSRACSTAAPDFRIIWDNAYAVHHLYPDPEPLADMRRGVPRRRSPRPPAALHLDLEDHVRRRRHVRDRRQRRQHELVPRLAHEAHDRPRQDHAAAPRSLPARSRRPRRAHGEARRDPASEVRGGARDPRARARRRPASRRGAGRAAATSSASTCRTAAPRAVVERAKEAGVKLTGAGATFPRGKDPRNRNIRIAPSFPPLAELRQATEILALSVLLVAAESGAPVSGVAASAPRASGAATALSTPDLLPRVEIEPSRGGHAGHRALAARPRRRRPRLRADRPLPRRALGPLRVPARAGAAGDDQSGLRDAGLVRHHQPRARRRRRRPRRARRGGRSPRCSIARSERGVPSERTVLAGFSQGAGIALYTGLRHPRRLAGILVASGYELLAGDAGRRSGAGEPRDAHPVLSRPPRRSGPGRRRTRGLRSARPRRAQRRMAGVPDRPRGLDAGDRDHRRLAARDRATAPDAERL